MKLSIVTTLYSSELYVAEFYQRITQEARKITDNYEIIFVNDGSTDNSLDKTLEFYEQDSRVKVIDLSRNFGHHKAMMTGLSFAEGEFVFLIDCDLEEEPELLGKFWLELHKDNNLDAIYGVQTVRKGNWFEKKSGDLFYRIFNSLSEEKIAKNFLTIRLMKQNYVRNLINFTERELTFSVLISLNGFFTKEYEVEKLSNSPTTYSISRKLTMFFNAVVSSTARPLWMIFNFGLLITLSSVFYIVYLFYRKLFYDISIDGWTSVMISIFFFGGLVIFFLGVIGIYLSKIFIEVKNRPYTIIKTKYENNR